MKELIGVWNGAYYQFEGTETYCGKVNDGQKVKITIEEGRELVPGITYLFLGHDGGYRDKRTGEWINQFQVKFYKMLEPASRLGITKYLRRYASGCGLGPKTISEILDRYGPDTVAMIREHPRQVAQSTTRWSAEDAEKAADKLSAIAGLENTRLELMELLGQRGFPLTAIDKAIAKWGPHAVEAIKLNPFILMLEGISGCGFLRCDRLWIELGKPGDSMKRQMLAIWHVIHSDSSGNTWLKQAVAVEQYKQKISETIPNPEKAIAEGILDGWLAVRKDGKGIAWITTASRDFDEGVIAERVARMLSNDPETDLARSVEITHP